ncbi:hypothetical protein [Sphingomonas sp. Leaf4]|uniref:hypothetical protein n=1 Tax=Sphingomonas sp. Leaf4 TaxID=2876553 RepID=UPI001E5981C1|nr:hypothetical protein [Sphingomonas sp. Leaf4]
MSADPRPAFGWKEAVMLACSIVGPIAVVGGAVRSDGKTEALIEDTSRRVVQLEAEIRTDRERREADREIERVQAGQTADRLARIETRVLLVLPAAGAGR